MGQLFLVAVKDEDADALRWVMEKNSSSTYHIGKISLNTAQKHPASMRTATKLLNIICEVYGGGIWWFEKVIDYLKPLAEQVQGYSIIDRELKDDDSFEFMQRYEKKLIESKERGYDPLKILKY